MAADAASVAFAILPSASTRNSESTPVSRLFFSTSSVAVAGARRTAPTGVVVLAAAAARSACSSVRTRSTAVNGPVTCWDMPMPRFVTAVRKASIVARRCISMISPAAPMIAVVMTMPTSVSRRVSGGRVIGTPDPVAQARAPGPRRHSGRAVAHPCADMILSRNCARPTTQAPLVFVRPGWQARARTEGVVGSAWRPWRATAGSVPARAWTGQARP